MKRPHFDLIVLPEVTLLPYAGFTDKLRFSSDDDDLSRQRYCSWQTYKLTDDAICASSGMALDLECLPLSYDFQKSDFVVLFGGRTVSSAVAQAEYFRPYLHQLYRSNAHIVAIDNAVFTLAECGLLRGKEVTLHWRHQAQLRESYPDLKVREQSLFQTDGRITTSVGGTAAIELAEYLLAKKLAPLQAAKGLADMMVSQSRNPSDLFAWQDTPNVTDSYVHRALILMFEGLATPMTMDTLSKQVNLSRRQLDRKFVASFGKTCADYLQEMRLTRSAWLLLNSTYSIERIANLVGYPQTGYFRQRFQARFNLTPSQYRQQKSTQSNLGDLK